MQKPFPARLSKLILANCDQIANDTKFCQRDSKKFDPSAFVQSLLSAVTTGKASYNQIAATLGNRTEKSMSREAIAQRFNQKCAHFLSKIHQVIAGQNWPEGGVKNTIFKRLIIEDSTSAKLLKSNSENFPGCGNVRGATVGVKIDFAYDFFTGEVVSHTLEEARRQDIAIGNSCLAKVNKGDLVVRDMGYFSSAQFGEIEQLGGDWLSRLPLKVHVEVEKGKRLEDYLGAARKRGEKHVDVMVTMGCGKKRGVRKKVRLVAVRAEKKVARARREQRRAEAAKKGKNPTPESVVRDGWHLMVTSVSAEVLDVKQLAAVYRIRWAVEIEFRGWKQSLNLSAALNRKSKPEHLKALLLAGMIAHVLARQVAGVFEAAMEKGRLSCEKLYDLLSDHHVKAENLEALRKFSPDLRHTKRDKRKRTSPVAAGVAALTSR